MEEVAPDSFRRVPSSANGAIDDVIEANRETKKGRPFDE